MLTDKTVQFATAKTYVLSDLALCMGEGRGISPERVKAWKEKIDWFLNSRQYKELDRVDVEPMEFEWTNFPAFTTLQIFAGSQNMMIEIRCETEQLQGRIIFMSLYNDIVWGENGNRETVLRILSWFQSMLENVRKDIGRFLSLDQRRSGTELTYTNRIADIMMA